MVLGENSSALGVLGSCSVGLRCHSEITYEALVEMARESTSVTVDGGARHPYWWSEDIEKARKDCISIRRKLTRLKDLHNPLKEHLHLEFNNAKKSLKKELPLPTGLHGTIY